METTISLRAYSRRRGTSLRTIQSAIKSGRISGAVFRNETGRIIGIDPDWADALWEKWTDPTQAERKTRAKSAATREPAGDYLLHRSVRERVNAEIAQIDLEQRLGKLVDAAQAAAEFGAVLRQVRDAVMRLFEQLDVRLAINPQNTQLRTELRRDVRQLFEQFAKACGELAAKPAPARISATKYPVINGRKGRNA
jgi:hypothetical protein